MYACKECGTGNPLDSSFCKKCGSALPADELTEARSKLSEMLDEGNNLFTEGRTDEAMLIAEAAVVANPSSHLAYSLKGLCHERMGQVSEALECYEIAVGLNADSSLDKVKVAALRNRLAQRVIDVPEPNRRSAAMIGVAAAVLFLVGGSLAAIGMSGKKENGKVTVNTPASSSANSGQVATGQSTNGQSSPGSGQVTPLIQTPSNPGGTQVNPSTGTAGSGNASALEAGPPLPPAPKALPDEGGLFGGGFKPLVIPEGSIGATTAVPHKDTKAQGPDPEPGPLRASGPQNAPPDPIRPEDASGYINIKMAPKTPLKPGGATVAEDSNGLRAVLSVAQEDYQLGRYDAAAGKYAEVVSMGGNSPRLQQRLGDCYRNLGNSAQARGAYNRAITMYQAQIKKGMDVAGNQRGLDTCESALKVLGG